MSKIVMCKVAAIFVVAAVVSAAGADGHSPRAVIEAWLALEGQAYLDARDALLAGESEPGSLAQQIREAGDDGTQSGGAFSQPDWLVLVFADALAMHGTHPQEARRLLNLEGLDPEVYTRQGRPVPSALQELRQMRHVVPLMIEFYLKGLDWHAWSYEDATEAERQALQADLLTVIGQSGHEASVPFLTEVVEDRDSIPADVFGTAVRALGSTGSPAALPVLLDVLEDARRDDDLALFALTVEALGSIRDVRTWPHLKAELRHADPRVRAAAIRGARAYGSRWHWDHAPAQGEALRREIGELLIDILVETGDAQIAGAVLASVGSLATPSLRDSLQSEADHPFQNPSGWARGASDAGSSPATPSIPPGSAKERLKRALSLVNRSLSRR